MRLVDIFEHTDVVVQMAWEKNKLEFPSKVVMRDENGIYITPYFRENRPVPLHITMRDEVVCSVFADDPITGSRIAWKNLDLETRDVGHRKLYYVNTSGFNSDSFEAERRVHERTLEEKRGFLTIDNKQLPVVVHDISDNGLSFYISQETTVPLAGHFFIHFNDSVRQEYFELKIKCKVVRSREQDGNLIYGCKVLEPSRDYLLYVYLHRRIGN